MSELTESNGDHKEDKNATLAPSIWDLDSTKVEERNRERLAQQERDKSEQDAKEKRLLSLERRLSNAIYDNRVTYFNFEQIVDCRRRFKSYLGKCPLNSEGTFKGFRKSTADLTGVLDCASALNMRKNHRLGAYYRALEFKRGYQGYVMAYSEETILPEFIETDEKFRDVSLSGIFTDPLACIDGVDCIEEMPGVFSDWSYMEASILSRELSGYGTHWHGVFWGVSSILHGNPFCKNYIVKGCQTAIGKISGDIIGAEIPDPNAYDEWKFERVVQDWRPLVFADEDGSYVSFYTFCGRSIESIFHHIDFYPNGDSYVAESLFDLIATGGKGGFSI